MENRNLDLESKMKRLLSILSVAAGLLLGVTVPHSASAQVTPRTSCSNLSNGGYVPNYPGQYPKDKHFYDCVTPTPPQTGPTSDEAQVGNSLTGFDGFPLGPFFDTLANGSITGVFVYTFPDAATANVVLSDQLLANGQCGASSTSKPYVIALAKSCSVYGSPVTLTIQTYTGIADHEFGHLWDNTHSYPATSTLYDKFVQEDFYYLDFIAGTTNRRPPCGSGGVFTGELDRQHGNAAICNATTGAPNSPYNGSVQVTIGTTKTKLTTNGLILQYIFPYYFTKVNDTNGVTGWVELYAQEFGYQANGLTGGTNVAPITEVSPFLQIYFNCSNATYMSQVINTGKAPTALPSGQCSTTIPVGAHKYS
jgi:hypothetical protein